MSYGITNGKVSRRKGKNYVAYNPMVIKNRRHPITGKSGFEVIWNFGTIRSNQVKDKANAFWEEVELVLTTLVRDGKIYAVDADKIRRSLPNTFLFQLCQSPHLPHLNRCQSLNLNPLQMSSKGLPSGSKTFCNYVGKNQTKKVKSSQARCYVAEPFGS